MSGRREGDVEQAARDEACRRRGEEQANADAERGDAEALANHHAEHRMPISRVRRPAENAMRP